MKQTVIERITASLAVTLLTILTFGVIIMLANVFFEWDIFPPQVEKFLYFITASIFVTILSSVAINIMINISRLANHTQIIVDRK